MLNTVNEDNALRKKIIFKCKQVSMNNVKMPKKMREQRGVFLYVTRTLNLCGPMYFSTDE